MPTYFGTYRATVAPAGRDRLEYMNIHHHFAAVSDGMSALMVRLGLGPIQIQDRRMSFAVVRGETDLMKGRDGGN